MNGIARAMFPEKAALYDAGLCTECETSINFTDFRDEKSRAEVKISGLCQKCQDKIFGA